MAKGKMFSEKRVHKRLDKDFEITYKLIPKEISDNPVKSMGTTKDISIGGVCVKGELIGTTGDVLRVEIATSAVSPTVVFAEIKWVKDQQGEFGVEFLALRETDVEIIEEILAKY